MTETRKIVEENVKRVEIFRDETIITLSPAFNHFQSNNIRSTIAYIFRSHNIDIKQVLLDFVFQIHFENVRFVY